MKTVSPQLLSVDNLWWLLVPLFCLALIRIADRGIVGMDSSRVVGGGLVVLVAAVLGRMHGLV